MIKKMLILCCVVVLCASVVCAMPDPIDFKGTKIRFFDDRQNFTECLNNLEYIPEYYFEGLRYIDVYYNVDSYVRGKYYLGLKGIKSLDGCNIDTMIHELAHHEQLKRGDSFHEIFTHTGNFSKYEEAIKYYYRLNKYGVFDTKNLYG